MDKSPVELDTTWRVGRPNSGFLLGPDAVLAPHLFSFGAMGVQVGSALGQLRCRAEYFGCRRDARRDGSNEMANGLRRIRSLTRAPESRAV